MQKQFSRGDSYSTLSRILEHWQLHKTKNVFSALFQTVPVIRKKVTAVKPKKVSRNYLITNTEGEKLRVCLSFFFCHILHQSPSNWYLYE